MHEDGIGMARNFELEFTGRSETERLPESGFFSSVDGAPAEGYRAPRLEGGSAASPAGGGGQMVTLRPRANAPVAVLTGALGAQVIAPIVAAHGDTGRPARLVVVENRFFGGNIGVTGLMVGEDVARVLADEPAGHRYLLPDVCLSGGRFLDGMRVEELPCPVEVLPTSGSALRAALEGRV